MKNIKYLFIAFAFIPFISFANDSVSIDSITQIAGNSATISGTSVYDTTGTTTVTLSTGATRENYGTLWSYTFPLKTGRYTVTATNGNSVVKEFVVASNEGGLICSANQPDCGMPHFFGDLMASQKPVEVPVVVKPISQMTREEIQIQLVSLMTQLVGLLQQLMAMK